MEGDCTTFLVQLRGISLAFPTTAHYILHSFVGATLFESFPGKSIPFLMEKNGRKEGEGVVIDGRRWRVVSLRSVRKDEERFECK